ncbi:MAG TPA: glycoside hydrolase family 57 protein [Syntrophorhabdaceae bacterium]|nr:glycoside hydrolase family 57 protein [Syntrophorhabdaceae bacterium]HOL04714.1 glycoside hydrolase family 57 protein [Syntrophorhabdaceae bacterium]HON85267.1 glycoside hydrolase family 57 protein [Syntrophorhabdaceae bacterium]HOT42594.1 glycoside hydrolase family 57 protein [Syntrophorhabdaceae bacterium]HPC66148.1 glycoside hydrolase family 57 protein [Syntrophorhabdaceae bacterium]
MDTIYLSFLWHMHQPFYKNLWTGEYMLPWVLLHSTKDYFDMPYMLKEYRGIRQNFNIVPSLLIQILDYEKSQVRDIYLDVFKKPAEELTENDKSFLLMNFFNANWENMVKPIPRYYELLRKRGFYYSRENVDSIRRYFSEQDYRDIQVSFFLAWIDPVFFDIYEPLRELRNKGGRFTEEDKGIIESVQRDILKGIIPLYKDLSQNGQIELSTSPFYHPIIPLLIDNRVAKEALPDIALPERPFACPEDASLQIEKALRYFEGVFGFTPYGMWPPEGSVSNDALKLYMRHGINWVATDEAILFKSLNMEGRKGQENLLSHPEYLYRPYRFERDGNTINIIFRDRELSDLVSFHYSKMSPKDAANDLLKRILKIGDSIRYKLPTPLINITMDGENAWENYINDGRDFFRYLYEGIENEKRIRCTTISEYLKNTDSFGHMTNCFAGSWINHNFSVWIGDVEDNTSWSLLTETRDFLVSKDPKRENTNAWESIYIAEGSDWNWWYGEEHASENDEIFDLLFRENLSNVYRFLGFEPPDKLTIPVIIEDREIRPSREPVNFIHPIIDGKMTNYFEWIGSGFLEGRSHGVAVHEAVSLMKGLYYGFNEKSLYLRVDIDKKYINGAKDFAFEIHIETAQAFDIQYNVHDNSVNASIPIDICFVDILEAGIPFESLKIKPDDNIEIWVSLKIKDMKVDRIPSRGYLSFPAPSKNFEMEMWYV